MKPRVYIETTIVSYLTALPSRDIVTAAHQQLTREWWARRSRYQLFASEAVLGEAAGGDPAAAQRRLRELADVRMLAITPGARDLARALIEARIVPATSAVDALHVATAAVHGMHFLITWNCTHIANASLRQRIEGLCRLRGLEPPTICTPEELAEE
ncbi:MAG: type II toxin-antitoxin system VapC family toxin [Planctomycetes bacterium]|nr:type II toxin-antitoxin system VapC family toxin [Planctomycetota bacterium]